MLGRFVLVVALLGTARIATAQDTAPDDSEPVVAPVLEPSEVPPAREVPVSEKADEKVVVATKTPAYLLLPDSKLDFVGTIGGSLDRSALAAGVGVRYRFAHDWHVGLHGEYNPYLSITNSRFRTGSANFFGSIDYRWTRSGHARIGLTTIGYAGISWLLSDLYGVPRGSIGPYLAIAPLCAEVRLSKGLTLLVESPRLAVPLPQISGVPFGYRQYRLSIGLAVALD
jgi:hypothetical protein